MFWGLKHQATVEEEGAQDHPPLTLGASHIYVMPNMPAPLTESYLQTQNNCDFISWAATIMMVSERCPRQKPKINTADR